MDAIANHYGNKFRIAEAYLKKAQDLAIIKAEDTSGLTSYSLFLLEYYNTMEGLDYAEELDHTYNIKALVAKLPYKLRERWRAVSSEIQETRSVVFTDLSKFVEKQAKIASNR